MSTLIFSPEKRHIAIAEVVIFSLIQIIQCTTRFMQEWKYWHHDKQKSVPRCIFYSWYGLIGLVAQRRTGPGNSRYPKTIRFLLHFFRFPVFFGIVLIVVGESAAVYACKVVGSVLLVLIFAFGCGLFSWLAVAYRSVLPRAGHRCVLLVLAALPFFVVRIAYMLLAQYGPRRFDPANGDGGVMVGMGLLMEIMIMIILLSARAVAEPIRGKVDSGVDEARV
ncbi:hypothetical protein AFCA_001852 [Aspergillus flavus]|nr:hypothetical protein AFCA_001852 [Aspergillus flavus]